MISIWRGCVCILILFPSTAAAAAAANEIEAAVEDLRAEGIATAPDPDGLLQDPRMARLTTAIRRGEEASGRLRQQIQTLEEQKSSLERVQVVLTSGLIGALVTAGVALFGAFSSFRRSRAERDLRRLEVIEKAHLLSQQGVPLPQEFSQWLPEQR